MRFVILISLSLSCTSLTPKSGDLTQQKVVRKELLIREIVSSSIKLTDEIFIGADTLFLIEKDNRSKPVQSYRLSTLVYKDSNTYTFGINTIIMENEYKRVSMLPSIVFEKFKDNLSFGLTKRLQAEKSINLCYSEDKNYVYGMKQEFAKTLFRRQKRSNVTDSFRIPFNVMGVVSFHRVDLGKDDKPEFILIGEGNLTDLLVVTLNIFRLDSEAIQLIPR